MTTHRSITVRGTMTKPNHLCCPSCGNTDSFHLLWIGDLNQSFAQDAYGERGDYDGHDNEGENVYLEAELSCTHCDMVVVRRPVTIDVGDWEYWNPDANSFHAAPALECWNATGQYPDSTEDYYDTYVLMPKHWSENLVRAALVAHATDEQQDTLATLLADAALRPVPYRMIDGQLFVPAVTQNVRYR